MKSILRFIRTIRHLRPIQWRARLWNAVRPPVRPMSLDCSLRIRRDEWTRPIHRSDAWQTKGRVRLLNRSVSLGWPPDWSAPSEDRLWCYNLHYFADLPSASSTPARSWLADLVDDWIDRNPPGTSTAWEPFPISQRVVNWVKWILNGGEPTKKVADSLALQVHHLSGQIEYHLLGNHLIANAKGLVFGGLIFEGQPAAEWLEKGFRLLAQEVREQILTDGAHFELSPMYHALTLEDLMDVLNLMRAYRKDVPSGWHELDPMLHEIVTRMSGWLRAMTHPDGEIGFFNDATHGVASAPNALLDYADRLGIAPPPPDTAPIVHLEPSGFFRLTSPNGRSVVLFDVGPVGPDYQPGHAHCDALSFELSHDGERLFVNTGISTYAPGGSRTRQRQTAAHNTLRIDGREQSEVWAAHRCGRRAYPRDVATRRGWAQGGHDGYRFLPGKPAHCRRITMETGRLSIEDAVTGAGTHLLEWFFNLYPALSASVAENRVEITRDCKIIGTLTFPLGVSVAVEPSTWHPGFNTSVSNLTITASWRGALPVTHTVCIAWAK